MSRIIISVTNDLVTDQRVRKVCDTLLNEGFEILLIGRKMKKSFTLERAYPTYRMKLFFTKGFAFYAEFNIRLFIKLLFTRKDILVANDLDTLLPNFLISRLFKKKLVYDSHELFTEVPELTTRPKVQNLWLKIERWIFPKLKNVITVCESIATYYYNLYGVPVSVIRNLPLKKQMSAVGAFPFDTENKKIIIYQGALNKGRGLELLIETMSLLSDWLLVIVGDGDLTKDLKKKASTSKRLEKVFFMGKLPPEQLKKLTPLASVGVSIEEDMGLNYHYALPNKIFDYIHAKVPILVSDLPEMRKIVEDYKVGAVLYERNAHNLANQLEKIVKQPKTTWSFNKALSELNWQKEEKQLLNIYRNLH